MSNIIKDAVKDLPVGFEILYNKELYVIQSKYMEDDKEENGTTYVMYGEGTAKGKRLEIHWSRLFEEDDVKFCYELNDLVLLEMEAKKSATKTTIKVMTCEKCGAPLLSTRECSAGCHLKSTDDTLKEMQDFLDDISPETQKVEEKKQEYVQCAGCGKLTSVREEYCEHCGY